MMQGTKALCMALLILAAALAGCADDEPADDGDHEGEHEDHEDSMSDPESSDDEELPEDGGTEEPPIEYAAFLEADETGGDIPLNVTFTMLVEAFTRDGNDTFDVAPGNFTWSMAFGDGGEAGPSGDQDDFPGAATHEYEAAGNFTAVFRLTPEEGDAQAANVTIRTEIGEAPLPPADPVHFEFGPSLGCAWDIPTIGGQSEFVCLSVEAGPDAPAPIDGFWIPLDERYWGMAFSSTVDKGPGPCSGGEQPWPLCDSDCFVFGESLVQEERIADGNNGEGACQGVVPEGATWLFVTPWGTPSSGIVVDFSIA